MKIIINKITPIVLAFLILCAANIFEQFSNRPIINISKENSAINIESNFLKLFNLGLKRFLSSYIWVQTVLESDIEQYQQKDGNSWIYHRISSITDLDPNFEWAYLWGGQYLSVIKDDVEGAEIIYKKGLKKFPNNFWLNFYTGFHYYWELNDCASAFRIFNRIKDHPIAKKQVPYLPSLTARAKACEGDLETAFLIVNNSYQNALEGSNLKNKWFENAYAIKAEIDLNCLNSKKTNCDHNDFANNPYLFINGIYKAKRPWKKFRIKFRKRN